MEAKVFIGCSVEALRIARYIQTQLQHIALVQIWNQGIFRAGDFTLERLLEIVNEYDFAVFIVKPDDIATIRDKHYLIARDNTLFEAGLFFTRLGRKRTILVAPTETHNLDFHLPSDLAGLTLAKYRPFTDPEELAPRLGHVCTEIEDIIEREGLVNDLSIDKTINSLSGGMIYLLRHLEFRTHLHGELAQILMKFNSVNDNQCLIAWDKAARYALHTLYALGLAEGVGTNECIITQAGRLLLKNKKINEIFNREMNMNI